MVSMECWVMPASAPASEVGGVMMTPSCTTKMFSPVHSLTLPLGASRMASS